MIPSFIYIYSLFCNNISHFDDVARCDETLVSLINLIIFYGFVPCSVLGIDIRPEIKNRLHIEK